MNLPPLILASASPRRADLMRQLELPFDVLPATIEEIMHDQLTGVELAQINAYRKARSIAKKHPDALVIGMDTVVVLQTTIFGKPRTRSNAEQILRRLQGKTHQVVTGVCLIHLRRHHQKVFSDLTDVTFRSLGPAQIRSYLSKINPMDKAGAYAIQEHGDDIVRTISGSFSNVVGLPIERLREELNSFDRVLEPA